MDQYYIPRRGTRRAASFSVILFFVLACGLELVTGLTETSKSYPAISLDYKIHIDAGREDCYHQYVMPGSVVYINFQVIKGGDGKAGFAVKGPNGEFLMPYEWKEEASYDTQGGVGGYYSLCIDNQFSKFSAKLVSVYFTAYYAADWERFSEEFEKLEVSVGNATNSISTVYTNMGHVLQYLHHSRSRESRDYALLLDNNYYISFWSIVQCLIIIGTGGFHVYFIRKLFDAPSPTGKTRTRL